MLEVVLSNRFIEYLYGEQLQIKNKKSIRNERKR